MTGIEERINGMARQVAEGHGYEVEDVKLMGRGRKMLLRVTIDKPGGVTLGDCETMSRGLEALLDLEDPVKASYTLEVSSPGLDRPLRKPEDFRRHTGKLIRLTTREKVEAGNFFIGRIIEAGEDGIMLSVGDKQVDILFENISSARLEIEL